MDGEKELTRKRKEKKTLFRVHRVVRYGAHCASSYLQCKDLLPVTFIFTLCVSSHLFVCVRVHVCGWCTDHDTCVEIRQSVGVCAILSPCRAQGSNQGLGVGRTCFQCWGISPALGTLSKRLLFPCITFNTIPAFLPCLIFLSLFY